ncbi:MAG TPA: zf-HC2 domain-containing protein [Actinomycetota bacterium]|nr:zf-HC2 domain-containing protein [Actinomycetota bacterium]
MNPGWHLDASTLEDYAGGRLTDAAAWSVESHLTACQACRGQLEHIAVPERLDLEGRLEAIWDETIWQLDHRRRRPVEWLLERVGVPEHLARLLSATPSLTASWLLAVTAVLLFAAAAGNFMVPAGVDPLAGRSIFLVLAPLVPLAGVAAAFGPAVDPTYEVGVASPLSGGRLLFLRGVAVLAVSFLLASLASLLLPSLDWTVVAWILPALAVSVLALALSTALEPVVASSWVAAGWLAAVIGSEVSSEVALVAFRQTGQKTAAVALTVGLAVLMLRRERFDAEALK